MKGARGFTAVELAVCLSISAVLVPSVFVFARSLESTQRVARWHLENADAVQRIDEALQRDAQRGVVEQGALAWGGACPVRYVVTEAFALERQAGEACGGTQVLATGVRSLTRVPGGVALSFGLALREDLLQQTDVFFALEAR